MTDRRPDNEPRDPRGEPHTVDDAAPMRASEDPTLRSAPGRVSTYEQPSRWQLVRSRISTWQLVLMALAAVSLIVWLLVWLVF
jgi:hypothetical protein